MILLLYSDLIKFSLFICFLSIYSTLNGSACDILCTLTGNRIPTPRTPNWKKANINQTPHLHARMAERGGKSVFSSNLRARLSAAEDDRMRPNNGKLSESVCVLKSNIQQQCYFLPRRHTSHIKLKLVKHQSFRQSSKRIFCTFIICINAALNYRFFWSLCCLIWLSVSSYCVILQK